MSALQEHVGEANNVYGHVCRARAEDYEGRHRHAEVGADEASDGSVRGCDRPETAGDVRAVLVSDGFQENDKLEMCNASRVDVHRTSNENCFSFTLVDSHGCDGPETASDTDVDFALISGSFHQRDKPETCSAGRADVYCVSHTSDFCGCDGFKNGFDSDCRRNILRLTENVCKINRKCIGQNNKDSGCSVVNNHAKCHESVRTVFPSHQEAVRLTRLPKAAMER